MVAAMGVDALLKDGGVEYAKVRRRRARRGRGVGLGVDHAIPEEQIVKTLLLVDARGYGLAVLPRNRHLDLNAVAAEFGRAFRVASKEEVLRLFPGLPPRALPPVGGPDIETFVDQSLVMLANVYLETADSRRLARVDGEAFRGLLYGAWCGRISQPAARGIVRGA